MLPPRIDCSSSLEPVFSLQLCDSTGQQGATIEKTRMLGVASTKIFNEDEKESGEPPHPPHMNLDAAFRLASMDFSQKIDVTNLCSDIGPPMATVRIDWPAGNRLFGEVQCAANVQALRCSPEQISTWILSVPRSHDQLCASGAEKINGASTPAEVQGALFSFLSDILAGCLPAEKIALKTVKHETLVEAVCGAGLDDATIRTPLALLAGNMLVKQIDDAFDTELVERSASQDRRLLRRTRAEVRASFAEGDDTMVAEHGRFITDFERSALQPILGDVVLLIEAVCNSTVQDAEGEDGDDLSVGAKRLAERLLALHRIAPVDDPVHCGLLVESAERARIMVLVQTLDEITAIWVTPPSQSAEQLADYVLLAVLRRAPQLRALLGRMDAEYGGDLLRSYQDRVDAHCQLLDEAAERAIREMWEGEDVGK